MVALVARHHRHEAYVTADDRLQFGLPTIATGAHIAEGPIVITVRRHKGYTDINITFGARNTFGVAAE